MANYVWVVLEVDNGQYPDPDRIVAICSTEEKADTYVDNNDPPTHYCDWSIRKWELDCIEGEMSGREVLVPLRTRDGKRIAPQKRSR